MEIYDLAIVGGGPIGLTAAIEARLAGLSVIVIEQRAGAIDKACGEGLMPGAMPILDRLGVDPEGMPIVGITYNQGSRSVTHRFAGSPGRGVRRTTLQAALAERASELGVERMSAKVDEIIQTTDSVTAAGITARYLLACDGLHSTVAQLVGLAKPRPRSTTSSTIGNASGNTIDSATGNTTRVPKGTSRSKPRGNSRRRYGIRQHFRLAPWGDTVEVYYGARAEIYITPVAEDEVGVAILGSQHTDFDAAIAAIPALARRLEGAPTASKRRGAGPFRQRTRARTAGRVLLVGDASGYVDAITGEGLRLGFAQAGAAIDAILRNRPQDYERAWKRITHDFRITTNALVFAATSPLRGAIVPLSAALPGRFGAVIESLAR